jgi:glyoxylase-like metal-dependent hydrolase (beta-lactamase superfamily II)
MRFFICLILAALSAAAQPQTSKPKYEIYAIQYAKVKDFAVNGLIAGADPSRKMDIAMMVWLVKGGGRNIVVDSGFYRERFLTQWKPVEFAKPSDAVARAGVKPEDVTDLIITHIHWDHADGADLFPRAKIRIQKDELEYYSDLAAKGGRRNAADPVDLEMLQKLNAEGRVALVNGDAQEILPGITCYTGGKHTYASQYVGVNTAIGTVILASDNVYLYENLEKHLPIAQTLDAESNLRAQDRMKQLAAAPKWIIPGHDPAVLTNFPEVAPGGVTIQ